MPHACTLGEQLWTYPHATLRIQSPDGLTVRVRGKCSCFLHPSLLRIDQSQSLPKLAHTGWELQSPQSHDGPMY